MENYIATETVVLSYYHNYELDLYTSVGFEKITVPLKQQVGSTTIPGVLTPEDAKNPPRSTEPVDSGTETPTSQRRVFLKLTVAAVVIGVSVCSLWYVCKKRNCCRTKNG